MGDGVVPPCSELGQSAEHQVLAWMSQKMKRPMEYQRLLDRLGREVFDSGHGQGKAERALTHLKDQDTEFIRKVDIGTSWGLEVVEKCWCEAFSIDLFPTPRPQGGKGLSLRAKPVGEPNTSMSSGSIGTSISDRASNTNGPPSALNSVVLARDIFPQVLGGLNPLQSNWQALASQLNRWHSQGVEWVFVHRMMEEFAKHPDWCRRSKRSPWRVFLSRREELAGLIISQQRQQPYSRRFRDLRGESFWNGRPTSRAYSPA
jgi:hypothetical protein